MSLYSLTESIVYCHLNFREDGRQDYHTFQENQHCGGDTRDKRQGKQELGIITKDQQDSASDKGLVVKAGGPDFISGTNRMAEGENRENQPCKIVF